MACAHVVAAGVECVVGVLILWQAGSLCTCVVYVRANAVAAGACVECVVDDWMC